MACAILLPFITPYFRLQHGSERERAFRCFSPRFQTSVWELISAELLLYNVLGKTQIFESGDLRSTGVDGPEDLPTTTLTFETADTAPIHLLQ